MQTVGLLTGVSYVSGIDYYRQINEGVATALASPTDIAGGHSSKMLLYSADLEEYVTRLTVAEEADDYAEVAVWFADMVEAYLSKADFLVIASNTVHLAVAEIERRGSLPPVLHIADSVARDCIARGLTTVGLVGTPHTMKQDWLLGRLRAHGLQVLNPAHPYEYLLLALPTTQAVHRCHYHPCLATLSADNNNNLKRRCFGPAGAGAGVRRRHGRDVPHHLRRALPHPDLNRLTTLDGWADPGVGGEGGDGGGAGLHGD